MKILDLFSGIGGFSLGMEAAGMETVAFCEKDKFCQQVLEKHWPGVNVFNDIRELAGSDVGDIDVITGGYPCQPFSTAGKRRGDQDDRHLWPEMFRIICEKRPAWVVCENVSGHVSMGLDQVLFDLESVGYSIQTFIVPAVACGAMHIRKRVWVVANSEGRDDRECVGKQIKRQKYKSGIGGSENYFPNPNPNRERPQVRKAFNGGFGEKEPKEKWADSQRENRWPTEPSVGRVAHGIPRRVDRLRSLGNSIVPRISFLIGTSIMAVCHES